MKHARAILQAISATTLKAPAAYGWFIERASAALCHIVAKT